MIRPEAHQLMHAHRKGLPVMGRGWFSVVVLACVVTAPMAMAAPGGWACDTGVCTAEDETPIAQLTGVFDHGANLLRSKQVDRVAELEQQRWREYRFMVVTPARIHARVTVDQADPPTDWPDDISLDDVNITVSRHYSLDGERYTQVDDGFVLPADAFLSVVVGQDTLESDTAYSYLPASWTLDITAQRVVDEDALATVDMAQLPIVSDDIIAPLGQVDNGIASLDDAIVATMPCVGADCAPLTDAEASVGSAGERLAAIATKNADNDEANPLAAELQTELARVGCYDMAVDGLWGPGSRRAMTNFNHWAGKDAAVDEPTPKALVTVARTAGPVCGVD